MGSSNPEAIGAKWRSSKYFVIGTMCIALFAEIFLYGFIVPILSYMFEDRLHRDPSETQRLTSAILGLYGYAAAMAGPIVGHFADKAPNRKTPLVLSLAGCIVGTVMVACSESLAILFIGRVLQSVAGSVVWIVGLATVADTVEQSRIGTAMGVVSTFATAGTISGPMVSGLLLQWAGYWATWSVPLVVLAVDIVLRMLMIEDAREPSLTPATEETTRLVGNSSDTPPPQVNFWKTMLLNRRVIVALFAQCVNVSVSGSFHATLPLHVRESFGWSTALVGMAFTCLTVPGLLMSPFAGWLRDRVGVRLPTTVAFVFQAIMVGLMGVAGNVKIPWIGVVSRGPALYTTALICFGIFRPVSSGVASIEVTGVVKTYQEKQPGIFGPGGGLSRVFSMVDVAGALGLTLGPIIAGFLTETIGYTLMSWFWSILYLILSVLVFLFSGPQEREINQPGLE
ncbi:putative MFS transporter [Aspergillus ambiguus]|uniref:putative MFS transporter n=1 Tax=Aspergillus ambiguus TaxID=176160 RepID=UPI003CCE354D